MVPFRQCKLTELLFSNSFPSSNQATGLNRHPQKAIMIVTADPMGDYNATSQILRYSALAREVAVPRAPSIAESILSSTLGSRHGSASGRNTPSMGTNEELEKALAEIARLTAENESLSVRLAEEEILRTDFELRLKASEERCIMIEQEVREECWNEMDERMEEERKRWQNALDQQVSLIPVQSNPPHTNQISLVSTTSISTRRLKSCPEDFKVSCGHKGSPTEDTNNLSSSRRPPTLLRRAGRRSRVRERPASQQDCSPGARAELPLSYQEVPVEEYSGDFSQLQYPRTRK